MSRSAAALGPVDALVSLGFNHQHWRLTAMHQQTTHGDPAQPIFNDIHELRLEIFTANMDISPVQVVLRLNNVVQRLDGLLLDLHAFVSRPTHQKVNSTADDRNVLQEGGPTES